MTNTTLQPVIAFRIAWADKTDPNITRVWSRDYVGPVPQYVADHCVPRGYADLIDGEADWPDEDDND